MLKRWIVLGGFALLPLGVGFLSANAQIAFAAPMQTNLIKISADHQDYDSVQNKSLFKGNVVVVYKNVEIRGNSGVVDVSPAGQAQLATFYNRPTAKRLEPAKGVDTLIGDVIKIHINDNTMNADGNTVTYVTTVAHDPFTIHADSQQFDNQTKTVVANGQVHVEYKEAQAYSPQATLKVGPDGKAERVIFTGGARLVKENSDVTGEKITIMVGSGNMIAENNVKTNVDLKDKGDGASRVLVNSDYQQYDKASDMVLASGHVVIFYGNYTATGPKASFQIQKGEVKQIYLTGRPSIVDQDRKVVGDKITITTNPRHFDAYGNVKTQFVTHPAPANAPASSASPAAKAGKPGAASKGKPTGKPTPAAEDLEE